MTLGTNDSYVCLPSSFSHTSMQRGQACLWSSPVGNQWKELFKATHCAEAPGKTVAL